MINKSPAFQFYPGDFLSDENVISMTFEERGVYITLLSICWIQGSIPADHTKIIRLLPGLSTPSVPDIVMDRFTIMPDNPVRLVNKRLEKERQKQEDFREKKSQAGKKGGASRWKKEQNNDGSAIVLPMANDSSLSSSSSPSSSSPLKPSEISEKSKPKNTDLENLWAKCLEMLKSQVSAENHHLFDDTFPSSLQGGTLCIAVPNQFKRKLMIENYREVIELFIHQISDKKTLVDFRIQRIQ